MRFKILLIEDQESFANALRLTLRDHPIDIVWAETGTEGITAYRQSIHSYATVIVDYCLPDLKGSEVVQHLRRINPTQDILCASGYRDSAYLIDLLETGGARSFLVKGRPIEEIREKILESLALYENKLRVIGADNYCPSKAEVELKTGGFIGRSAALYTVLEKIGNYRQSPYPVLIVGETGVGKELVAKALVPPEKSLISINCPRFIQSENLMESELFGYVKGAFTGASNDKPGLMAQAHGQVVFLDELHGLSASSQAKLLRFLQEMKYRRVGDHSGKETSVQFKLISATKPDIEARVRDGRFLEDLLHRVGQLVIRVPALRDRIDDIEPMVRHIQDEFNAGQPKSKVKQVRISTIHEMAKFNWSGNIRQLINVTRQMLTDCPGDIVNPSDFADAIAGGRQPSGSMNLPLEESIRQFEMEQITNILKVCRTQNEAAVRLGMNPSTLTRKMVRLGINPEAFLSRRPKERGII